MRSSRCGRRRSPCRRRALPDGRLGSPARGGSSPRSAEPAFSHLREGSRSVVGVGPKLTGNFTPAFRPRGHGGRGQGSRGSQGWVTVAVLPGVGVHQSARGQCSPGTTTCQFEFSLSFTARGQSSAGSAVPESGLGPKVGTEPGIVASLPGVRVRQAQPFQSQGWGRRSGQSRGIVAASLPGVRVRQAQPFQSQGWGRRSGQSRELLLLCQGSEFGRLSRSESGLGSKVGELLLLGQGSEFSRLSRSESGLESKVGTEPGIVATLPLTFHLGRACRPPILGREPGKQTLPFELLTSAGRLPQRQAGCWLTFVS